MSLIESQSARCPDESASTQLITLSENQRLIWLGQRLDPAVPLYEMVHVFRIDGSVDADRFREAFRRLVDCTDILRSTFGVAGTPDGAMIQHSSCRNPCEFLDLSGELTPDDPAEQFVKHRMNRRLELTETLYDSVLLRLSNARYWWYLKLHHLLTDGLNGRALLSALDTHYQSILTGQPAPGTHQYSAYIHHETTVKRRPDFQVSAAWWKERSVEREQSCFFKGRPTGASHFHDRVVISLSSEMTRRLKMAAQSAPYRQFSVALSQFNVFATALAVWLHRMEGSWEVCFGATVHGRTKSEFRETVGLFMQLLPLRVRISDGDTFASLSKTLATEISGFLKHAVPGVTAPETQKGFDVALNFLDLSVGDFSGAPVTMDWPHVGFGDSRRKLTLSVREHRNESGFELMFDFNRAAFSSEEQKRTADHFCAVLNSIESPESIISKLEFLTTGERAFIREQLGASRVGDPCGTQSPDVWETFVEVANSSPSVAALCDDNMTLTYSDLQQQALEIAALIATAECGSIVPVLCRRNASAVVAMLGVLAARRCFMPVDLDLPAAHIQELLDDSGARHVVDVAWAPMLREIVGKKSGVGAADDLRAQSACYLLYTSGSTGRSNGVLVGHVPLLNLLNAFEKIAPLSGVNCSWWTNVGFDVAIYEVFSALLFGRSLYIPDKRTRGTAGLLFDWLDRRQIASAYLPPFFLSEFDSFVNDQPGCQLQRLLVGVEPIPQQLLASIASRLPGLNLINGYGPTEAAVCATLLKIDRHDKSTGSASIGRLIAGNVGRIVDQYINDVPPGVAGELLIGGLGLAIGYHNRPELAAARFVHLEGPAGSERWYRTGDRVRQRSDGCLEYLGRVDDQIKIRGHRVEPSGVAQQLRNFDGITECVVTADKVSESIRLIAFFTATAALLDTELRAFLASRLPLALIPAIFVQVDSFPRKVNGKIDVAELLQQVELTSRLSMTAPRTPVEFTLHAIWKKILDSEDFGVDDNFFELGGDSLDAMRIVSEAEELAIEIAPSDVFSNPTVASLARLVTNALSSPDTVRRSDSGCALRLVSTQDAAPNPQGRITHSNETAQLSARQKRLWYLAQLYPQSPAYHLQIRFEIRGTLDPTRMAGCFRKLIERHAALRTNVALIVGEPVTKPTSGDGLEFQFEDLQNLSQQEQLARVAEVFGRHGTTPYDLRSDPLVRLSLFRFSDRESQMALTFHHISVDQQSVLVLLEELETLYANNNNLADATCESVMPRVGERQTSSDVWYWIEQLRDCRTTLDLPFDRAVKTRTLAGRVLEFPLPATLSNRLRTLAREQQVSLNVLMLAAFELLLHRCCSQDDLIVGVPVTTRRGSRADRAVGFFVESLPIRSRYNPAKSFSAFLRQTSEVFAEGLDHADAAFEKVVQAIRPVRTSGNPLFQCMLVTQKTLPQFSLRDGTVLTPKVAHLDTAKFDLTMFVMDTDDHLQCCVEYSSELFDTNTIDDFQRHWTGLLSSIVEQPERPVAELRLISAAEWQRVATNMSADKVPTETIDCIHQLIEEQARRDPEGVAILTVAGKISYGELNERANEMVRRLMREGVRNEVSVALCIDRSIDMVVAILAVLKSGGAYVPLDPAQPPERMRQILDDCDAIVVVADSRYADLFSHFAGSVIDAGSESTADSCLRGDVSVRTDGDSLAYIIYTSGSTGLSKGVEITHRNLVLSTLARNEHYHQPPTRFLLLSSYAFDSSVAGIFWTLSSGGTLVLPPPRMEHDVATLGELIRQEQVTHSLCLPSLYELLLDHTAAGDLDCLEVMIVAGEACLPRVARKHFARLPTAELHNEYGPTECTVWSTVQRIAPDDIHQEIPIGRPVQYTCACVLDQHRQPVPAGVAGELFLGGPKLARGYHNRAELTEVAFVSNPFDPFPESKIYRTGDRVRQRGDGSFVFLGRIDNQLKINGHRIEAEEIEAAIASCPGILQAVVGQAKVQQAPVMADVESLVASLESLPPAIAEQLLQEAEASKPQGFECDNPRDKALIVNHTEDQCTVRFELPQENFIETPRTSQRMWLLKQSMAEASSDLQHLHQIASKFVPGADDRHVPHDISSDRLTEQEIMEDWQYPLMKSMTRYATESHGDLLEIGFGRGVSATMIQELGVRSHTIVEANPYSISDHFLPWQARYTNRDIRMIEGRWQDVLSQLELYDSIFFHAFPLNEAEFVEYIANSVTFAEHFFATAAKLLRSGGVFTYLTTEIDSLSRRHQRSLFRHFDEVRMSVQPLSIPPETRDAWWANSMVVLQAKLSNTAAESEGGLR